MIVIVISLVLLVLHDNREQFAVKWSPIEKMRHVHGPIYFMMFLPLLLTLISGIEFLYNNRKAIRELMVSGQPPLDEDEDS